MGIGRRTARDGAPAEGQALVARANVLLSGLYAWVSTVAFPVALPGAGWLARAVAGLALVALVVGPWASLARPRLGRSIGVYGFVGCCLLCWVQLGDPLLEDALEPVRASLGAVGWSLFAFGWGAVRKSGSVPEDDPRAESGEPLEPREALSPSAYWVFVAALAGAVVPLFLAWQVTRPRHALFAHGAALAAAVALVTAGARVAVQRGARRGHDPPRQRLGAAAGSLSAAVALAMLGLVWVLLG